MFMIINKYEILLTANNIVPSPMLDPPDSPGTGSVRLSMCCPVYGVHAQ